ncbi:MAG: small ribosomal subunit Rsm22 family protein [Thermomicrobiales bacterium]
MRRTGCRRRCGDCGCADAVARPVARGRTRSLLDVGAGPGTVLWAAQAVWPSLERAVLLERDERMIAFGRRLAARGNAAVIREARWQEVDLLGSWEAAEHDLVVAAYVLNELPEERRAGVIEALWARARGGLLLLEPGTPAGFARIREARRQLLAAGATVLAPCPHDAACPMPDDDWCHFGQRINRTRTHREAKGRCCHEDEKFSYVAVSRRAGPEIGARTRRPQISPGRGAPLHTGGVRVEVATRGKDKEAFCEAREARWGMHW